MLKQGLHSALTVLLIVGVNLLSLTVTCYNQLIGAVTDGHQHSFFHVFETYSDSEHHAQQERHDHDCSLHSSGSAMVAFLAPNACDLGLGPQTLAAIPDIPYQKLSLLQTLSLSSIHPVPPEDPPELRTQS
jgi:hypothetical protein